MTLFLLRLKKLTVCSTGITIGLQEETENPPEGVAPGQITQVHRT